MWGSQIISTWFYCQIKVLLDIKKHLSSSWVYACKDMWLRVWRLIHFVIAFCNSFRSLIFFSIWLFVPLSREVGRKWKAFMIRVRGLVLVWKLRDSLGITCIPTVTQLFYHEECENILKVFSWEKNSSATTRQDPKKCFWFLAQYFWSRRMLLIDYFLAYSLIEFKCIKREMFLFSN